MFAKLEGLEKKYMELEQALAQPDVYNDQDQYRKLTKAHADLRDVVELFRRHRSLTQELEENKQLLHDSDPDIKAMAQEEIAAAEAELPELEHKIKVLLLPKDPERKNAEFLGWFTEATGGTQVTANDTFTETADKTYYAHWEITEVFSVTVPVTLPLVVDESGEVHTGSAEIINASTGTVVVSSVSISTKNGWQLVPYTTDMAHEKVDAKLLGFKINDAQTNKTGDTEIFSLTSPWEIAENSRLPLSYDAVVSAVSKAVTEQEVLSIVFVLEWGGE